MKYKLTDKARENLDRFLRFYLPDCRIDEEGLSRAIERERGRGWADLDLHMNDFVYGLTIDEQEREMKYLVFWQDTVNAD